MIAFLYITKLCDNNVFTTVTRYVFSSCNKNLNKLPKFEITSPWTTDTHNCIQNEYI